ncbi:MAG: polysaccharide biosynthesis protein [Magnetococcales bacterium]|nr:polysaccharide biosynthesis protein [Magnetococcales bacterium]NGZ27084.1 polysaccharide biosynthesis protein [Magnetococcales bacterium]
MSDMVWVLLSLWGAGQLHGNLHSSLPQSDWGGLFDSFTEQGITPLLLLFFLPSQFILFIRERLYRGLWRFASIPDLIRIIKASLMGTLLLGVYVYILRIDTFPSSTLLLYPLLLIMGLGGSRLTYRWLKDYHFKPTDQELKKNNVLVIGAGIGGDIIIRDALRNPDHHIVGLLDDNFSKLGTEIHGIRVLGTVQDLEKTLASHHVDTVFLAIASPSRHLVQNVLSVCTKLHVECRILPSLRELVDGKVNISRLRQVTVEDLLGRHSVQLDVAMITNCFFGQVVMVTGGGGSIGSEACRQVAHQHPSKLIILDHSEYNLYQVEMELRREFGSLNIHAVLGDVKNSELVSHLFATHNPQVVIHAAAYKHVPMVEENPIEGVRNNVFGTITVARLAHQFGSSRFVMISTDKAVRPTNVMGASKRIAEIYCQNLNAHSQTRFITVRFGNVLASAGSVVPLFRQQIAKGGPVTLTHPDITRYFMTIPEAVGLVLQAGAMGEGGEIFVLDMGEPVKIKELAEQMIRLSGMEPHVDIPITYIGLRPGEKLYEELFHEDEDLQNTNHAKVMLAKSRVVDQTWLEEQLILLNKFIQGRNTAQLLDQLKILVPEFSTAKTNNPITAVTTHVASEVETSGKTLF